MLAAAPTQGETKEGDKGPRPTPLEIIPHGICLHPGAIQSVCATSDFKYFFTAGSDGVVRRFDMFASLNGRIMLTQNQKHGIADVITKSGVLESSWENIVPKSEFDNLPLSKRVPVPLFSLAVHSQGVWALSGQKGGRIKLWSSRVYEGMCHHVFREHTDTVCSIKVLPGEKGFISGSWDKSLIQWDLNTGKCVRSFLGHNSNVTNVSLAPDSLDPVILSSSLDGTLCCWDMRTEKPIKILDLPDEDTWILTTCWGSDGSKLYCGRRNETIDEWDFGEGRLRRQIKLPPNSGAVSCVRSFKNGQHLLCGSEDSIRIFDLHYQAPLNKKQKPKFQILAAHSGGAISDAVLSDNMDFLVTASGDRGLLGNSDKMCIFYEIKSPHVS